MTPPKQTFLACLTGLATWRPGRLAKGTFAMTAAMGLRSLGQTAVFLIVARVLGIADYGAYAAVLALSTVFACFSGWGTQGLMVRDVSRHPKRFPAAWGQTLTAISISSPILFAIYIAFAWVVLPESISLVVIAIIGLADLVFAPIGTSGTTAYQGHEHLGRAAYIALIPVLYRLAGALVLLPLEHILSDDIRLSAWSLLYALAAFATTVHAWRSVHRDLGPAEKPSLLYLRSSLRESIAFAFGGAAQKIYADIDKMMLARLDTIRVAGAYSAGYRVADLATVPLVSLLTAALPRFFRAGDAGLGATLGYAHRILLVSLTYSILAGLGLYLCASILPVLLGATYVDAVPVLQWLAWLPAVSLPRLLLQTLLIGGDRQNYAVSVLAGGGLFNIALNLCWIPEWGWRGAVAATYAAEIAMALAMCVITFFSRGRHNPSVLGNRIGNSRHRPGAAKRLALFLPSLAGGGAEKRMLNLAAEFARKGYAVDMLLSKSEGAYLGSVPPRVHVIDLHASRPLTAIPALARYLSSEKPRVLLSTITSANLAAVLASQLSAVKTRCVLCEASNLSIELRQSPAHNRFLMPHLLRRFFLKAHALVAVSHGVADDLARVTGIPRRSIRVIYNPVVCADLLARSREPTEHPWLQNGPLPVIVAMGRLTWQKDFSTLLRAFALVREQLPSRLIILGEGEERPILQRLSLSLCIDRDVDLPGFVLNPYPFLSRASLFVLSSRWEGLPWVLIEALACGTKVVATDCPSGPREILDNGAYGQLCPVADVSGMAAAMTRALTGAFVAADPTHWLEQFSLEANSARYLEISLGREADA